MTWRATILTLFPEMFPGPLGLSLAGKALSEGKWALAAVDIRDFATDKHRSIDDTPAGGGAGMVMRADIAAASIDAARASMPADAPTIYLSPRGKPLTQGRARALAAGPGVILLCGRFEGVDERVLEADASLELAGSVRPTLRIKGFITSADGDFPLVLEVSEVDVTLIDGP